MSISNPKIEIDTILDTVPFILSNVLDKEKQLATLERYESRAYELKAICDYPSPKLRKRFAQAFFRIGGSKTKRNLTLENYSDVF